MFIAWNASESDLVTVRPASYIRMRSIILEEDEDGLSINAAVTLLIIK